MSIESHHEMTGKPLRVAVVHSFYSSKNPSGENVAVGQHIDALRRAGHEVELFAQRTDIREQRKSYAIEAAWTVATGLGPRIHLEAFRPDIIHVHNMFPNYGKRWISRSSVPIVASLHNYRPLCSNGLFYRDGSICTACLDQKSGYPAVKHGCYRGALRTIPIVLGQRFENDRLLVEADALIALSSQMESFYVTAGVPADKMKILPNFLPTKLDSGIGDGGDTWLYAGRISDEKGLLPLLDRWPSDRKLIVAGSGELSKEAKDVAAGNTNIDFVGPVERGRMISLMKKSIGLVFPSRCLEGFPMVYAEALSTGTPVLTWDPTVMANLVRTDLSGHVGSGENIASDVYTAEKSFHSIRAHCRSVFEGKYTESAWVRQLVSVYRSCIYS